MRLIYIPLAYFALVSLFHLTGLTEVFFHTRLSVSELPGASLSLPALGVAMIFEGMSVMVPFLAAILLLLVGVLFWRRRLGWPAIALALFSLQIGGLAGMEIMGSV